MAILLGRLSFAASKSAEGLGRIFCIEIFGILHLWKNRSFYKGLEIFIIYRCQIQWKMLIQNYERFTTCRSTKIQTNYSCQTTKQIFPQNCEKKEKTLCKNDRNW
jgi:hypothetical protein